MIQFHVYPGGLKRIVTFSFDDGSQNDVRLISLFDKYRLKATFHLNGKNYIGKTADELKNVRAIYQNYEENRHPNQLHLQFVANIRCSEIQLLTYNQGWK